nr:hypothetical protein [Tanacetum cinerariifolium]
MEDTILELVKNCREKEFFCIHDNVDDLIESALNSKLLLINSSSQRLDKKEQEVKNVIEQPAERGTQLEHSLSMGYEHLSITPETESDEVTKSNAKKLLPIPSECEVTFDDEIECDVPDKDNCSPAFTTFSNPLFNNDDLDYSNDESLPEEDVPTEEFKVYSNPLYDEDEINSVKLDPHCFNVESDFVESLLNRDIFIDSFSKFDFSGELAHINPEIPESDFDYEEEIHLSENLLYVNSTSQPPKEHNVEEERIKREHADYISQIDIITSMDDVLPPSVENDDSNREVDEVDDLHSDHESSESKESDFDNPSVPLPPPEPLDIELDFEIDFGDEISVVRNTIVEFECIDRVRKRSLTLDLPPSD